MSFNFKSGGSWRTLATGWIKDTTWKQVASIWVKDTTWKQVYTSLTATADETSVSSSGAGAPPLSAG